MKILVSTLLVAPLFLYGVYELVSLNEKMEIEQRSSALKVCEKNNFKGWVKLKGDFNVYKCIKASKSVEII